jgi:hypothetical protein
VKKKAKRKHKIEEGIYMDNLSRSDLRNFWRKIKSKKKSNIQPDYLTINDLFEHFRTLYGNNNSDFENTRTVNNDSTQNDTDFNELDIPFTEKELKAAVFAQKNNKSPSNDEITGEIIKAAYEIISPFLLNLYNRMFHTGEYPVSWGEGIISPIFKKGDINDAKNYRGVTLINILAKIYSQLLLNRFSKLSHITDNQFGFQKGKSIIDCIFILNSVISKVLDSGQRLYCIFIDYEQCFDKIDRSLLWQKLNSENISCKLVRAIKSMYQTVKSCVRFNSNKSDFFSSNIGLKQGDPSSPLLFMLFVNDINECITSDLNGMFTIDEIKLFLLLYADDQVLFAKSPETLQHILNDIQQYCNIWGLKINTSKTKAMIFEKGRHTTYNFYINNTQIELVNSFKYLGMTFFKNGNWTRSQKTIAQHASIALHNLFGIFRNVELHLSQKIKMFDTLITSILNFGAEVWGNQPATDIELIHTKFLRRILCVKKSTHLSALYGETGRFPLAVKRKILMLKYWSKICNQDNNSLLKRAYLMIKDDANANRTYNGQNWAYQIKNILDNHGLSYIWNNQSVSNIQLELIKSRILDNYKQTWYSTINNSSKLDAYSLFKHEFEFEKYLQNIPDGKFKVALTKFRISSHTLRIETGRYENLPQKERLCRYCNMQQIESEFHFLLVCPHYSKLRSKYLKPYYNHWPTINKFEQLMSTSTPKNLLNLAKYIYFANLKRNV